MELLSCPLCARSLETLELELGDLEGGRGEADGLHDFPQVRTHDGMQFIKQSVNGGWLLILFKDLFKVFCKCTLAKTNITAG